MKKFNILSNNSLYTNPTTNIRQQGIFLRKSIDAYYHDEYHAGNTTLRITNGTVENIITTLKNQFQDKNKEVLLKAKLQLIDILNTDLLQIINRNDHDKIVLLLKENFPDIYEKMGFNNFIVCVIPRAKAEKIYSSDQLFFKEAVQIAIKKFNEFIDGTNYIIRHTNTRTTHLDKSKYGGDGDLPYPGITKKTCAISNKVYGKNILLIDDLYTEGVNIDEDAIQALFDAGATNVIFYSIGKTI